MTELTTWEAAWETLKAAFDDVARRLAALNPDLQWTIGHHETDVFPFNAYCTFSRFGTAGVEDIVIFVGVQRKDEQLWWTSDISTGEGVVLSDGPSGEGPQTGGERWVEPLLLKTVRYLESQEELLRRSLT